MKATTHRDAYRLYQAFKLLRTLRIQHASSSTAAPRVTNYSKYKPLKQKLIGPMEEAHTKQQSPETVSETELQAKRPKTAGLRARTRERERERERESNGDFFSGGSW